jgi:hypothetical protein
LGTFSVLEPKHGVFFVDLFKLGIFLFIEHVWDVSPRELFRVVANKGSMASTATNELRFFAPVDFGGADHEYVATTATYSCFLKVLIFGGGFFCAHNYGPLSFGVSGFSAE